MRLLITLLALLPFGSIAGEQREALYPDNPNMADEAVFVADTGLTRLEYGGLEPSWHQLEGLFPLEPVVVNDLVVVGSPVGIFALDAASGAIRWHVASSHTLYSPTVIGSTAYVGGEDGSLRALDLEDGDVRWRQDLSGWVFSPAVVGDQLVTGGGAGVLWGVSGEDGSKRWQRTTGEELVFRPIAGREGPVYISTVQGKLIAVSADNGAVDWQTTLDTPSTTTVYGDRLLLGQFSGLVAAYNRYTGAKIWEHQLKGPTTIPIKILDGKVVAITEEGNSVLLDLEDGQVLEEIEHEEPPPAEPDPDKPEFLASGPFASD
ncbi:MAG: PQQ-like beta-propeller repeat protein [Gammaproteobacteria bacterium]|nr:PQQ-like beta-propeller repeat protein [Gammaproteobacteria bacterium]